MTFQERGKRLMLWVVAIPLIVYATNLDGKWIEDDHYVIESNPYLSSLKHLPRMMMTQAWESTAWDTRQSKIYRPVAMASYFVDSFLLGRSPAGSHFINNLIHALNALLLFLLVRRFVKQPWALFSALLFAVHPIAVEAVTWVSARMDLLALFFGLIHLQMICLANGAQRGRRMGALAVSMFMIPLGIFSKETFFLIPVCGLLLLEGSRRLRVVWTLLILAAMGSCLIWRGQIVHDSPGGLIALQNLWNASILFERMGTLILLPVTSDFLYPNSGGTQNPILGTAIILTVIGLLTLVLRSLRVKRLAWVGIALLLATLLPSALILDFEKIVHERYFYIPFAGLTLLAASAFDRFEERSGSWRWAGVLLLAMFAVATGIRNRDWTDEKTLYSASILRDDQNYLPYYFLSLHYRRLGDEAGEVDNCRKVLVRKPSEVRCLNSLGVRMIDRRDFESAKGFLKNAYSADPRRAQTSFNVGFLYEEQQVYDRALGWYRQAVHLDPTYQRAKEAVTRCEQLSQRRKVVRGKK